MSVPYRWKKIHLDANDCLELSKTAEGSKALRDPTQFSTSRKLYPSLLSLVPKSSKKMRKNVPITSIPHSKFGNAISDFISAREYLNPTFRLAEQSHSDSIEPFPTGGASSAFASSTLASSSNAAMKMAATANSTRFSKGSKIKTNQKNCLDNYFKPKCSSSLSSEYSQSVACSLPSVTTTRSIDEDCSVKFTSTPIGTPTKSVMYSPIYKIQGSDSMYCSQSSSSQNSEPSCRANLGKEFDNFADPDFEPATFKPATRRKSRKSLDSSRGSKRQKTREISSGLVDGYEKMNVTANKFGLFGFSESDLLNINSDTDFDDDSEIEKVDNFSRLPSEIVANILCRLPFLDLSLNVNRVCLAWRYIINSSTVSHYLF